jgi:hypothetical protein
MVIEYRLTIRPKPWLKVRFWIESDPAHGGCSPSEARAIVDNARSMVEYDPAGPLTMHDAAADVAKQFMQLVPSANSVEVCYADTENGVALHRNWP